MTRWLPKHTKFNPIISLLKVLRPYGQNSCGSGGWIFVAAVAYLKACIFVAESVTGISMRFHSAGAPLHRICIPAYTHRIPNGMPGHHIATNIKTTTRGTTPQWNTTTLVGTCLWHVMGANPQHNPQSGGGRKVLRALKKSSFFKTKTKNAYDL